MHHRECNKTTATGPLGLAALPNSELYVHGLRDAPLDLSHLHEEQRRVLVLFPSEDARPLSKELIAEDSKPVTLVVPDGNWRQASRVPRRIPGLVDAERVTLPLGPPSRWGVRTEPRLGGLATFEAIARAMGILESKEVQAQLEVLFDRLVESTFAARGEKVLPLVDSPSAENLSVSRQGELEKRAGEESRRRKQEKGAGEGSKALAGLAWPGLALPCLLEPGPSCLRF